MSRTIQLYVVPKEHSEPSNSAFCQKLETFFRAADVRDYTPVFSAPLGAPKGKLPYIVVESDDHTSTTIADSHFIIQYLIRERLAKDLDTDAGLTDTQRAESRAWQAYMEELAFPAIILQRWTYPSNRTNLTKDILEGTSFPIKQFFRWILVRRMKKNLQGHGVGRHSEEEVNSLIEEFMKNLIVRLDSPKSREGGFFHGEEPTTIDCVLYGFLVNGLRMTSTPLFTGLILASETLRGYVERGTKRWFPEYSGILKMVGSEVSEK